MRQLCVSIKRIGVAVATVALASIASSSFARQTGSGTSTGTAGGAGSGSASSIYHQPNGAPQLYRSTSLSPTTAKKDTKSKSTSLYDKSKETIKLGKGGNAKTYRRLSASPYARGAGTAGDHRLYTGERSNEPPSPDDVAAADAVHYSKLLKRPTAGAKRKITRHVAHHIVTSPKHTTTKK